MMGEFSAKVGRHIARAKELMKAVRDDAAMETVAIMQTPGPSKANPGGGAGGAMPIQLGFLRASLKAVEGFGVPAMERPPEGVTTFTYDPAAVNLVILGADIETPITAAYSAIYARKQEMKYGFVRLAAQRWPQTVAAAVAKAESLVPPAG